MASANNKNKKFIYAMASGIVVLAVIIGLTVFFLNNSKNKNNNSTDVFVDNVDLTGQGSTVAFNEKDKIKCTVNIELDDCACLVGTIFKAAATVTPYSVDNALVWSSSNNDVFSVSDTGIVTIKGPGTAVLTATVGNVSDAIVIEGLSSIITGSVNDLPVVSYPEFSPGTGGESSGGTGTGGESSGGTGSSGSTGSTGSSGGSSGNSGSTGSSGNSGGSSGNSGSSGGSSGNSGSTGSSGNSGGSSGNSGGSIGSTGNTGSSEPETKPSETLPDGETVNSDNIGDYLPGKGFSQILSNVYVYNEDGKYYGEIITQPYTTIMYIKERTTGFDERIKSVLSLYFGDKYMQVWNNYISATSDRTFTVDDIKVRIVVASAGGHSQIVIYN